MGILESIKSVASILVFLSIGAAFFLLVGFEFHYGVAGGKFGGADIHTAPGTFWFVIGMQSLLGLHLVTDSIGDAWMLFHRNNLENDSDKPARIIAIYWLLATLFFLMVNLLAVWSAFEMLSNAYQLLDEFEMPKKAIFAGGFLLVFLILCNIIYQFLFRTLIETFYSKARASFQVLRRTNKQG